MTWIRYKTTKINLEIGVRKVSSLQHAPGQVGPGQPGSPQVGILEVDVAQVQLG